MRQTRSDDALVGLVAAIMNQAIEDFYILQKNGVLNSEGEVVGFVGAIQTKKVRIQKVIDGMRDLNEVVVLTKFLKGWGLDLLCDLTGTHACRIRKKLGIKKSEAE